MSDDTGNRTVVLASEREGDRQAHEIGHRQTLPWGMPGSYDPVPVYQGKHRGDRTVLSVETDVEAVASWLAETANRSKNTAERYRRDVERLLLWAASHGKSLSDLGREDFLLYAEFLKAPYPAADWIMVGRHHRNSPYWRPFLGPLGEASRFQTLAVVYSLMRHLVETGWLYSNPMPRPRRERSAITPSTKEKSVDDVHALTGRQEALLRHAAHEVADPVDRARMVWAVQLLLTAGLRTTEVVEGTMHWLRTVSVHGEVHWVLDVLGKGGKSRTIPIGSETFTALMDFRKAIGVRSRLGDPDEPPYPLFPATRGFRPGVDGRWKAVSRNGLYKRLQAVLEAAAKIADEKVLREPDLAEQHEMDAKALRKATTHDLRHTALKNLADKVGGDMRLVKAFAGHASIETSSIYTRSNLSDLIQAIS